MFAKFATKMEETSKQKRPNRTNITQRNMRRSIWSIILANIRLFVKLCGKQLCFSMTTKVLAHLLACQPSEEAKASGLPLKKEKKN